ncbi:MAG: DUF420 domain-containing protein [Planctomycetes bacterium]|nr:DUF420 domain-containing protein [Planctomycetota bacterium]
MIAVLPHINAGLNAIAAMLLVAGSVFIRAGRERAHRTAMLGALGVSLLFLVGYAIHHMAIGGSRRFPPDAPSAARAVYLFVLATHAVLAAATPFLAVATAVLGILDRRSAHRRLARWTLPVWWYVSVTGIVVYAMLYHLYDTNG